MRPVLPYELLGVVEHVEYIDFLRHFDSEDDRLKLKVRVQLQRLEQVRTSVVEMHEKLAEFLS